MEERSNLPSTLSERIKVALDIRDGSLEQLGSLHEQVARKPLPLDVSDFPRTCGFLSKEEIDLTENHDATALLQMLRGRKLRATSLLSAFRKRASIAQLCTNCLTELLPEAIADAAACDAYLEQHGKPIGPLHGLPISLKEQISVAGHATNAGFVAWVNNIAPEDANIVRTLKNLGAVIFARTNQPQSLMHLETFNNVYGATINPRNRLLTAGGSTGGECALMAMGGSPLGIGGDIGGSIRVPAALNGVYGLLPTIGRFSGQGVEIPSPGMDSISGTLGPFTRSLRDLEVFCRAYSSAEPWKKDISLLPAELLSPSIGRQLQPAKLLRVGVLSDDGVVSPLPPVRRVMNLVKERLQIAPKIDAKDFAPLDHTRAWQILSANYFEEEGDDIRRICAEGNEPLLPLTEWIIEQCQESSRGLGPTMHRRKALRDGFRQEYADHWEKSEVDVVIMPVTPSTAPPLGTSKYWGYSSIWNLLQYTSISMPMVETLGRDAIGDFSQDTYEPKNDIEKHYWQHYDAVQALTLPVGVQLVARRFEENLLMQAAYIVEDALRNPRAA